MMRRIAVCLVSLVLTSPVWAQDQEHKDSPPATGGSGMPMDMSKMGPWTRKPTNEAQTRKEIEAWVKEGDAIMKRRDFEADIARADFPIYMATDNSKGIPSTETYDRQKYVEMVKPMFEQMPADMQAKHKLDITVLSDSLVVLEDDFTLTMGGQKYSGKNAGLLVKRDGQWKWKAFFEAGWGDMPPPAAVGGSGMQEDPEKPQ
ncbi:nuclear transport factor 2 family protein [Archangium lipolyticum]|uniref:hypothetical protein n=1 Tax=Archangium lipolyticum TaxID=2970465 RepID=UPI00214A68DE|nr:hypothetical protein [Archangium lipolyticum]